MYPNWSKNLTGCHLFRRTFWKLWPIWCHLLICTIFTNMKLTARAHLNIIVACKIQLFPPEYTLPDIHIQNTPFVCHTPLQKDTILATFSDNNFMAFFQTRFCWNLAMPLLFVLQLSMLPNSSNIWCNCLSMSMQQYATRYCKVK
jgi:hypothetical protein